MARIDKIDDHLIINISAPVGINNSVNNPDDVLVIQALLRYCAIMLRRNGLSSQGVMGIRCPEPTGAFNPATAKAIRGFQKFLNDLIGDLPGTSKAVEDGRVSPAQGRFLFGSNAYVWTIVSLNSQADYYHYLEYGSARRGAYISQICRRFPAVKAALERDSVGSLGLELE